MVALTSVAFGCFQKITEVNLKAAKAAFVGQQGVAAALAANDPLARRLQSSLIQPATESALAYSRQIQEIVAAAQVEFQQVIDADHEQNGRRAQDYVAHVVKHLPACADAAIALWQSALAAANGTYEAAIQASEVARANMAAPNASRVPA